MHVNTATKCPSRYTVDKSLVLQCDIPVERHHSDLMGDLMHKAPAYGVYWYWKDREADK